MSDIVFEKCKEIAELLKAGSAMAETARIKLIYLLSYLEEKKLPRGHLVCALAAECGLYPYITPESASWRDCITMDACSADVGDSKKAVLHRGQVSVLLRLLDGENIVLSAPTSFGKSFIIDAFIAIKNPKNVMIIVPTVALMDETRRRLNHKFGSLYNIITMGGEPIKERNIFIFPQERVFGYIESLPFLDILVVDEAYKASSMRRDERTSVLQNAILKLTDKAKQRYYLMPCVNSLDLNTPLLKGMKFIRQDFSPVALEYHDIYKKKRYNESVGNFKKNALLQILGSLEKKTLIYAGIHAEIEKISKIILEREEFPNNALLQSFASWLEENYSEDFYLCNLIKRKTGVHSGKLHRFLCQIQVGLFAEPDGLNNLISTSSIIEGVNTSAENVVLWGRRTGGGVIDYFTYRNIAGRGGRMFKCFVGNVYNLTEPPPPVETPLDMDIMDEYVEALYPPETTTKDLTWEQIKKIKAYNEEVDSLVGEEGAYRRLIKDNPSISVTPNEFVEIIHSMKDSEHWIELQALNDDPPHLWSSKTLNNLVGRFWKKAPCSHAKLVKYLQIAYQGWNLNLRDMLRKLKEKGIDEPEYFKIEKFISNEFVTLIREYNLAYNMTHAKKCELDILLARLSSAFLPKLVFELEEMGLPRMLSRKIQNAGLIDLERTDISMNEVLREMREVGVDKMKQLLGCSGTFENYIFDNFYQGI